MQERQKKAWVLYTNVYNSLVIMPRIAIFDSGLGSLSVIGPLRRTLRSEIIYYADTDSFPYGTKTRAELGRIITGTIAGLRRLFKPDLVIVGSNTPSLLLPEILDDRTLGVHPPLSRAAGMTGTGNVAVLTTESVAAGPELRRYIEGCRLPEGISVLPVNCSPLIRLVESGGFVLDAPRCRREISRVLADRLGQGGIDTATLSSTHLPFLRGMMEAEFPDVRFLDPADDVAQQAGARVGSAKTQGPLRIFASGDAGAFSRKLAALGMDCRVDPIAL